MRSGFGPWLGAPIDKAEGTSGQEPFAPTSHRRWSETVAEALTGPPLSRSPRDTMMERTVKQSRCVECKRGRLVKSSEPDRVTVGGINVVYRGVPAHRCDSCGAVYF